MYSILNKKIITKSLLFDYVSHFNIAAGAGATKTDLIERIVQLWKDKYPSRGNAETVQPPPPPQHISYHITNNHLILNNRYGIYM